MKHLTLLFPVLLMAIALGFAFGAQPPPAKLKFPYAPAELNRPCGRTELEWQCLLKSMRPSAPTRLNRRWSIIRFEAKPEPKGLLVAAEIAPRPGNDHGPADKDWQTQMKYVSWAVEHAAYRRFLKLEEGSPHLTLRLHFDGKLQGTYHHGTYTPAPPKKPARAG